ncbi:unnamed protein product [Cunninghamella echinulata]
MSEGELRRRQDLLSTLKEEKDTLLKLVSNGRQEHDLLYTNSTTNTNNNNKSSSSSSSNLIEEKNEQEEEEKNSKNNNNNQQHDMKETTPMMKDRNLLLGDKIQRNSTGSRAFGASFKQQLAKETEVTRGLDNEGIVGHQRQLMEDQDQQVEQFSAILNRQKQLGYAIGDELETQNQLLDELDNDVGRTQTKMKFANKKLNKIK